MNIKQAIGLTLPPMELKGKGTSTYTLADINRRLTAISDMTTAEAEQEREYLRKLLKKMDP